MRKLPATSLRALVPNYPGAERAVAVGVPMISRLVAATPTYQRLNSNMTIEENLRDIEKSVDLARSNGIEVALGMAISFVCPYEGVVPLSSVLDVPRAALMSASTLTGSSTRQVGLGSSVAQRPILLRGFFIAAQR